MLSIVSTIIRIIGILSGLIAVILFVRSVDWQDSVQTAALSFSDQIQAFSSLALVLGSLVLVAIGESIRVLFAIEENTRRVAARKSEAQSDTSVSAPQSSPEPISPMDLRQSPSAPPLTGGAGTNGPEEFRAGGQCKGCGVKLFGSQIDAGYCTSCSK